MKKSYIILIFLLSIIFCINQIIAKKSDSRNSYINEYYFGIPLPNLDSSDKAAFWLGSELFNHLFLSNQVKAASFNALSCVTCHNTPVSGGSGVYQNTFVPFSMINDTNEKIFHRYSLHQNIITENNFPSDYILRKSQSLFGLGLLESMDIKLLISNDDPFDFNEDGISGRIRYTKNRKIGRFGWKANSSTIEEFVNLAYEQELGLSKNQSIIENYSFSDVVYLVTKYLKYLSPPYDISDSSKQVVHGALIFNRIGCNRCHLDKATTNSTDKNLNSISFKPFTDLLLHDLTNEAPLCNTVSDKLFRYEYRTPTLWGLNSTGPPYMHDGKALSIEDAISLHNGEARNSKLFFSNLSNGDKSHLITFLKSL